MKTINLDIKSPQDVPRLKEIELIAEGVRSRATSLLRCIAESSDPEQFNSMTEKALKDVKEANGVIKHIRSEVDKLLETNK